MSVAQEPAAVDTPPYEEIVRAAFGQVLRRAEIAPDADFFDLGGQSLQAVEVALELRRRTGIPVEMDLLFRHRRPVDLVAHLVGQAPTARQTPISPTEERLLFLDRLHPGSALYCVPVRYEFAGAVDTEALRAALQELVDRHEALRTCFTGDGRRLVRSAATLPWSVLDLSGEEPARAAVESRRHLDAQARRPVPTDVPPLARACLVTEPDDRAVLLLTLHHLIADQHSLDLLDRQFQQAYGERVGLDREPPSVRRRGLAGRPDEAESLAHWRGQLAGLGGRMSLPVDRRRPGVVGPTGEVVTAALDPTVVTRLTDLATRCAASEFMVLLAAYLAFLSRITAPAGATHAPDVVVGAPFGGRTADDERTVGMFVNVLPIRARIDADTTFRQLVAQVRGQVSAALAYQWTPLQELVAQLPDATGPGGHPLTQVSISHVDDRDWHWAPAGAPAVQGGAVHRHRQVRAAVDRHHRDDVGDVRPGGRRRPVHPGPGRGAARHAAGRPGPAQRRPGRAGHHGTFAPGRAGHHGVFAPGRAGHHGVGPGGPAGRSRVRPPAGGPAGARGGGAAGTGPPGGGRGPAR